MADANRTDANRTDTKRPDPLLLADHPALDVLNSTGAPYGETIEWIADGRDLVAFLDRSGLVTAAQARAVLADAAPGKADDLAREARALREAFRGFVGRHAGRSLDPSALGELEEVNRLLARARFRRVIAPAPRSRAPEKTRHRTLHRTQEPAPAFGWQTRLDWRRPDDLLVPMAQAMGELVCEADFALVKNCEGPSCTMWFLDTSKNHTRRWCSMAICGNRAKAAAFRERKTRARPATKAATGAAARPPRGTSGA